tara:strand:+ start:896 stop:1192 length:297 start_codon:yes stop_codon:yes gene_type:complete
MGISKVIKKFKALNDIFIKKSSTKANPEKKVDLLIYKDQATPIKPKHKRAGQKAVAKQKIKDLFGIKKTEKKAKKFKGGFMTKGQGAAVKGTKFKGIY